MTKTRKLMLFATSPIALLVLSVLTYIPQGNKPIGPYGNFLISEAHAWEYCNTQCDGIECSTSMSEWGLQ